MDKRAGLALIAISYHFPVQERINIMLIPNRNAVFSILGLGIALLACDPAYSENHLSKNNTRHGPAVQQWQKFILEDSHDDFSYGHNLESAADHGLNFDSQDNQQAGRLYGKNQPASRNHTFPTQPSHSTGLIAAAVPESESYILMLAGLVAISFITRRKAR
jgi:hypothetical protein